MFDVWGQRVRKPRAIPRKEARFKIKPHEYGVKLGLVGTPKDDVFRKLEALPEREAAFIRLYFGIESEPDTIRGIARRYGISDQRAGQVLRTALSRMAGEITGHRVPQNQ